MYSILLQSNFPVNLKDYNKSNTTLFFYFIFFSSNIFMLKHHDAKFFESLNVLFIDLTFYFFQILMIEEKKLRSCSYLTLTQNLLTFSSFFPLFSKFFSSFFPKFFLLTLTPYKTCATCLYIYGIVKY
jgi:hypothetical protein